MPNFTLDDINHTGYQANITFSANTGGTYSLGLQTIPYTFSSSLVDEYPWGKYTLVYPQWGQTCEIIIPDLTCNTDIKLIASSPTTTPTNTITPTQTPSNTATNTQTPSNTTTNTQTPTNTASSVTPTQTPTNTQTPTQTLTPNINSCQGADVVIGSQTWMKCNLSVDTYRNGDPIPNLTDNAAWTATTSGAWCNYNNDTVLGIIYGKLYNYYAAIDPRGIAPIGYHVPSLNEYQLLESQVSNNGGSLKETGTTLWNAPNLGATNSTNFSARPGGYRQFNDGSFILLNQYGFWWTTTDANSFQPNTAWDYALFYNSSSTLYGNSSYQFGWNIRCIKTITQSFVTSGMTINLDAPNSISYSGAGNTWYDLSGNNNHGILNNSPSYVLNQGKSYFSFDSNLSQWVDCGPASRGSSTGDFTFGAWFNANDTNLTEKRILFRGRDGAPTPYFTNGWSLQLQMYGQLFQSAVIVTSPSIQYIPCQSSSIYNSNTWYYVVGTYSNGNQLKLYVNGSLINTVSLIGTSTLRYSDDGWVVSTWDTGGQGLPYTSGSQSAIHVYNRVLSDSEILQNFDALKNRYGY